MRTAILRVLSLFLLLASGFLPLAPAFAQESWVIESFDSRITIPASGKVRVTETITADFGLVAKHGIFRTIPTEGIKFRLLEVTQDGSPAIVSESSSSRETEVRIGDPNRTITGRHVYVISYEVGKVITRFEDHDELYWNVTGNDWGTTIRRATAEVVLEPGEIERVVCFTGRLGSQAQECAAEIGDGGGRFATTQPLSAGEGLTVANSFPSGLVADPFYLEDLLKPLWLILGSLAAVGYVLRQWWRHGRDMWYKAHVVDDPAAEAGIKPLFTRQTVVPEFEPPAGLRPGEVGTLVDERVDIKDISAAIVDLAVRGYLRIIESKKGRKTVYAFEKRKEFAGDPELNDWETEVLAGIFKSGDLVELSDLKDRFYRRLPAIREKLYAHLAEEKYFVQPPDKVAAQYLKRFGGLAVAAALLFYILRNLQLWWIPVPLIVLAFSLLISAKFMPRKTARGTEAVRRASGFKLFISTAQKYQQEFNERINYFDQFLPYAMVFGVVDKWVGAFKEIGVELPSPSWYVGPGPFNMIGFSSSVNAMTSDLNSTLPSRPSSQGGSGFGGGGFSGGGFGGGGGGSW